MLLFRVSGGSDRSVAPIHRIGLQLGTLLFCGSYQEVPFPIASVPFCGAGVFQCCGCCFLFNSVCCVYFCLWSQIFDVRRKSPKGRHQREMLDSVLDPLMASLH